eukprot:TRINITY_DN16311_c0_g1_i1.p1 TRINITY_DN16311_c0_g1~~TRINITY_DN16311_c0_g1_i1.p1  ORF type:complete len:208 (-),score=54.39 TRINITY_DN16311_c0_g1_i1:9-632(-)
MNYNITKQNTQKHTDTYSSISKIAFISSSTILTGNRILAQFNNRDILTKSKKTIQHYYTFNEKTKEFSEDENIFPVEISTIHTSYSPSRKYMATFNQIEAGKNYQIQIYERNNLISSIITKGIHQKINLDEYFSSFSWNEDESKLLYVAEPMPREKKGFFSDGKEKGRVGSEFEFEENWGEQNDCISPNAYVLDIEKEKIEDMELRP